MSDAALTSFIFVGGTPHAGMSLVRNIFNAHPNIYSAPEFKRLEDVVKLRSTLCNSVQNGLMDAVYAHKELDNGFRQLIEGFFKNIPQKKSCKFISEHTPQNIFVFLDLMELFPQAKFVHVMRDPRAAVAYLVDQKIQTLGEAIELTRRCFRCGFEAQERFPHKIFTIVYERLLEDPMIETKRLCNFLNIDWDEAVLGPIEQGGSQENSETQTKDSWTKSLKPGVQVRVTKAFENLPELKELGYELSLRHLNAHQLYWGTLKNNTRQLLRRILLSAKD